MRNKILFVFLTLIIFMLLIPIIIVNSLKTNIGIGWAFIFFFGVNPLISLILGVLAGTDIKKIWWVPFLVAVAFPLLFGIVIHELVLDLYIYSGIYLIIGIVSMIITSGLKNKL